MTPADYAQLAATAYSDTPTIGLANSASRMHVYETPAGAVHVFRGTDDAKSAFADINITTMSVWGMGDVHAGFYGALAAILPACLALPRPTAVVGHSLGAAMAILYAGVLALLDHVGPVYAFEPPRLCADAQLHDLLVAKKVPWLATRNGLDLVTQVPMTLTLPGPLTVVGTHTFPVDNIADHAIARVAAALIGLPLDVQPISV